MPKQPDVLIIVADQLSQRAVGCERDPGREEAGVVRTPHIDALAARGRRFAQTYCPYPLCMPSRAAFWSGLLPHRTGIDSNGGDRAVPPFPAQLPTLGTLFSAAGYRCLHFGKRHDAGALRGFQLVEEAQEEVAARPGIPVGSDSRKDAYTSRRTCAWLRGQDPISGPGDEPFCCVVDIQNPHDICSWIGAHRDQHPDQPVVRPLPRPLDNAICPEWERRPRALQYVCCAHNRQAQAAVWTEANFRHYLAAYYDFVEEADARLGEILDALAASGRAENCLVVFFSDHGDQMGAHRLVTKHTSFSEESARVPFIWAGPGIPADGQRLTGAPASLCDLLPTLCQACGIAVPLAVDGVGQWDALRSGGCASRPYVVSQWESEWGYTVEPGRMLCTGRYKYTCYRPCENDDEQNDEEFFDLANDPGEQLSLLGDPTYEAEIARHRTLFNEYLGRSADPFLERYGHVDPRWRQHPPGPEGHRGLAAPETIWAERKPTA